MLFSGGAKQKKICLKVIKKKEKEKRKKCEISWK